ncbi:unnamed protein product [Candida verbasci]|uniref:histone acetyltransferase n=1 Tax=Candida verbasci TaxID=1227364 RepID=A0A9W4TPU7_9ASCO|nr:unnamed protein product [Candida verbasci]
MIDLSNLLPANQNFKLLYIQSKPTYIKSPIYANKHIDTVKIRHFFLLLQNDIIVMALEIFSYLQIGTEVTQFIFISKCDTVGLIKLNFKLSSIIEYLINYVINYNLANYKIKNKKVKKPSDPNTLDSIINKLQFNKYVPYYNEIKQEKVEEFRTLPNSQNVKICLFTRSAPQYIFPESSVNEFKHLITGQSLLRWWIKIINGVSPNFTKKLLIPGTDINSTYKFINSSWQIGHIFNDGLACYNIPIFPDDPKGRFIEHLIVGNRYSHVDVSQFYCELESRQEFRIGDCVGLIGAEKDDIKIGGEGGDGIVVSLHDYKSFMKLIKSVYYNKLINVENMSTVDIPKFFENIGIAFDYLKFKGSMEMKIEEKVIDKPVVNNLVVKRKTNDLTGMIRKKKNKKI